MPKVERVLINLKMNAKIRKSYLTDIPHEGGKIIFQYPAFRGHYGNVAEAIDKDKLERPISPKTASLIYDAFQNPRGEYELEIIKTLNEKTLFFEFTGNLYLPKSNEEINNGVILESNPKIENGYLVMDKQSLIKKLQNAEEFRIKGNPIFISLDRLVVFVPSGYKTGKQTIEELEVNPYMVGRYIGRKNNELEHSAQIAKIASKYNKNPQLRSFDSVDEEEVRMSTLDSPWGFADELNIHGDYWSNIDEGSAFGILK